MEASSSNPFVEHYFHDDETDVFVITEILHSNEITVSAKDRNGVQIGASIPAIKGMIGAKVSVAAKTSESTDLTYKGVDPLTFGFKAFAIAFDGRWRITGVTPDAATALSSEAFSPEIVPVILGRGRLKLE